MVRRAEALLESLTVVVSARVVQYADRPAQVHVLSGSDVPVSKVVRTVASALLTGLGLEVAASQISVAQSRLAADDLVRLLGRDVGQAAAQPASEPVAPPASPPAPPMRDPMPEPEAVAAPAQTPDHAPANAPANGPASAPDSLMSEPAPPPASETEGESRNDTQPTPPVRPPIDIASRPRFRLLDVDVVRDDAGGLAVGVSLHGNGRSVERQCAGADTEEAIPELPAAATLEAVQELMGAEGWGDGQQVTFKLLGARRLRTAQHDFVVVLVEARANGQTLPLAGSASTDDGVELASIKATLQATNPFVTGPPVADSRAQTSAPRAVGAENPTSGVAHHCAPLATGPPRPPASVNPPPFWGPSPPGRGLTGANPPGQSSRACGTLMLLASLRHIMQV